MKSKQPKVLVFASQKRRKKKLRASLRRTTRRDRATNVYTPTDTEVAELKAWSEFCKL